MHTTITADTQFLYIGVRFDEFLVSIGTRLLVDSYLLCDAPRKMHGFLRRPSPLLSPLSSSQSV